MKKTSKKKAATKKKAAKKTSTKRGLEARVRRIQKEIASLAQKYEEASPLEASVRRMEAATQLARMVKLAERWYALELLGELAKEQQRQLGRIGAEIRKWMDELKISHNDPDADDDAIGFMGALDG